MYGPKHNYLTKGVFKIKGGVVGGDCTRRKAFAPRGAPTWGQEATVPSSTKGDIPGLSTIIFRAGRFERDGGWREGGPTAAGTSLGTLGKGRYPLLLNRSKEGKELREKGKVTKAIQAHCLGDRNHVWRSPFSKGTLEPRSPLANRSPVGKSNLALKKVNVTFGGGPKPQIKTGKRWSPSLRAREKKKGEEQTS